MENDRLVEEKNDIETNYICVETAKHADELAQQRCTEYRMF